MDICILYSAIKSAIYNQCFRARAYVWASSNFDRSHAIEDCPLPVSLLYYPRVELSLTFRKKQLEFSVYINTYYIEKKSYMYKKSPLILTLKIVVQKQNHFK